MKILDIYDNVLTNPDLTHGELKEDKIFVKHHPAVNATPEEWHYEIIAEYENGGKDIKKVIDVPYAPGKEAWDEYETIYRYIEIAAEPEEPSEIDLLRAKVEQLEQIVAQYSNIIEAGINATIE